MQAGYGANKLCCSWKAIPADFFSMLVSPAQDWLADFLILAAIWGLSFLFMRMAAVELGPRPTTAI